MKFPDKVKFLREKKGMTQEELAKLAHVSQVAIHAYENGKARPLWNNAVQLAKILHIDVSALMDDAQDIL